MRFMLAAAAIAMATPALADTYAVTAIGHGVMCPSVQATGPRPAMSICAANFWSNVPTSEIVITPTQVCRSTHIILNMTKPSKVYGYDRRYIKPGC